MTEAEWLNCTDPTPMLEFLRGKASDRKLRLVAVSFCRRIWHEMKDERSREAVEVAEQFADERASRQALRDSRQVGLAVCADVAPYFSHRWAEAAAATCLLDAMAAALHSSCPAWVYGHSASISERSEQTGLIRHIIRNPYRPVSINPLWLHWNDDTIPKIAQAIYDDRAFDRMPILADALEEAGCDNKDILDHLRGPGQHVRGCWVVDLLLQKE